MKKAFVLIAVLALWFGVKVVFAETGPANAAPEVSITDITNIIYPVPLPSGGGPITFTYKITNPGDVSLNDVTVVDDACSAMSGELGDTNGNHLLDPEEEWIYTCAATVTKTTAHTATVIGYANGLKASDAETATIDVPGSGITPSPTLPSDGSNPNAPGLPNNGTNPGTSFNITVLIWEILGGILVALIVVYLVITRKK